MTAINDFRDLIVWQRAMDLVVDIYAITDRLPAKEQFGLTTQARRAAVSVPANVAEGNGRGTKGEYLNHLSVARGSLMELQTHILIAQRLGYTGSTEATRVMTAAGEVGRMLSGLMSALRGNKRPSL
jgi:four helix bundle protein